MSVEASAQRTFTLQQAIDFALDNSYNVKNIRLNQESALQNLQATKGQFKTFANAFLLAPNLREELATVQFQDGIPDYRTTGTTQFAGTLNINQPLPTNGLFTLTSNLSQNQQSFFTFDEQSSTVKLERLDFLSSVTLRFRQPLFTPNTLKLGLEEANLDYENTTYDLRRTELDVIYSVTQSFFNYYRRVRQLEIARQELEQQQEAYDLASKKYNAGLIPEVEALQTEVDLAQSRNRVFTAETDLKRQEDFFKQTIGIPLEEEVSVLAEIDYKPVTIEQDRAVQFALENRLEIREAEIEQRLAEISVKRTKALSEFRVDLSAFYDLSGVSQTNDLGISPYTLFRESVDDLRDRPKNRGVSVTFSVPLWDSGVNRAQVAASRARLDQADLNLDNDKVTIVREVKDVVAQVIEGQKRLEVSEKSQRLAERSYEISLARFDNGDITSQDLALDRDRLTQTRSEFLDAYILYQTALADLKRKTLYDFENNRSLIE